MLAAFVALSLLSLTSCDTVSKTWQSTMAPPSSEYKPLSSDLAAMAAPESGGPVLHCKLGQGMARFAKGFTDFNTVDFTMIEGQRNAISLVSKNGDALQLQGILDRAGQKLIFCPVRTGAPDQQIACNSLYALDDDLATGIRRTFDIPDAVTGSVIVCGSDPSHLPPLHE